MQLALIVQLSIAMLARELSGSLPVGALGGALIAALGPVAAAILGSAVTRRVLRGMDRREPDAAMRMFGFASRAGWIGALAMFVAASTELPREIPGPFGGAAVAVYLLGCGIASILAAHWNAWPIEVRIRESAIIRTLDLARPLGPIPTRGAYILAQARAGLIPVIAPLIVPIALSEVAAAIARQHAPEHEMFAQLGGGIAGVVALFLVVPVLMPPLLGLTRLPEGEMRDELEELARSTGIGVREIWIWPTDGLVANAAVMGIFPGLRCVMLSDALVEGLPRGQVLAVLAHELGHVARRHLVWMLPVVFAAFFLGALVVNPVAQAITASFGDGDADGSIGSATALLRDGATLAAAVAIFGFVSRRFERQADTYAVQLLSRREGQGDATLSAVTAMTGALSSVAFLNHVPVERPSWRHGSIAWRQAYLRTLPGRPLATLPIDRAVRSICIAAAVVVVASVVVAFATTLLRPGA